MDFACNDSAGLNCYVGLKQPSFLWTTQETRSPLRIDWKIQSKAPAQTVPYDSLRAGINRIQVQNKWKNEQKKLCKKKNTRKNSQIHTFQSMRRIQDLRRIQGARSLRKARRIQDARSPRKARRIRDARSPHPSVLTQKNAADVSIRECRMICS